MKHSVKIAPEKRKDNTGELIITNVPIFADIRFLGTRLFYFTGFRIDVSRFDSKNQKVRKNSSGMEGGRIVQYNIINNRIEAIKAALVLFFQDTDTATKQQVVNLLDTICKKADKAPASTNKDFFYLFNKYHRVVNISEGRRKHVNSTINHWLRYEAKREIHLTFESITVDLLRDFESYLLKENFSPIGRSKKEVFSPLSINTAHTYLKITKDFWVNFAEGEFQRMNLTLHNPFDRKGYKIPAEAYGKPIYITIQERDKLYDAQLSSERLQRVSDTFVFQCLVGCRVGDLYKLTKNNIQNDILTFSPRKGIDGKPVVVSIPLHPKALDILKRYDLPDGRILPFITDQRYNDYLKDLFKEVGITRFVTRKNPNTRESEQVRICDIVSSHMARRAFVGNLYGKVDRGIITSMTGHAQESKALSRYYDVDAELQRKAIDLL